MGKKKKTTNALLQKDLNNDKIMTDPKALAQIMKKQTLRNQLENAGYHYWYAENKDVYICYVMERGKRRRVERKNEDDLIDYLLCLIDKEDDVTFKEAYGAWYEMHCNFIGDNSQTKYETDYRRYFEGTDFERMMVSDIQESDIKLFIVRKIKELDLNKKSSDTMFRIIRNVLDHEVAEERLKKSPIKTLRPREFHRFTHERIRPEDQTIISDENWEIIEYFLDDTIQKKPYYANVCYAIKMARYTGMRVAELSALRWDNIYEDRIHIDCSEKTSRKTGEQWIGYTKNEEVRDYPITSEIQWILDRCLETSKRFGFDLEWVFGTFEGRAGASIISSCLKNKCIQAQRKGYDIPIVGIHALRRTLNSKLHKSGVCRATAAALLGHSEEVNEKYYTFDITDNEEKRRLVESAMNEKKAESRTNVRKDSTFSPHLAPHFRQNDEPEKSSGFKIISNVARKFG